MFSIGDEHVPAVDLGGGRSYYRVHRCAEKPWDWEWSRSTQVARPAYDAIARALHWLTVLLIAMRFVIGWAMPDVHKDTRPAGLIA